MAEKALPEHQCEAKCSTGCVGPFCYCAGYDGDRTSVETLCLPPSLCREACDKLGAGCVGIQVHDTLPQCQLLLGEVGAQCVEVASNPLNATLVAQGNVRTEEAWQLFSKSPGTACTHLSDYTEVAGSLAVTTRVEVGVDYVLHPGKAGSVELTSPVALPEDEEGSLTFEHSPVYGFTARKLLSADRITIIDCKGTCGVSAPTTALELPEKAEDIATWNELAPNSWFVDLPHIDQPENPFMPKDSIEFAPSDPSRRYITREGMYCPESNFDVAKTSVPFGGTLQLLKTHQCYSKCFAGECTGDDCFCGGLYSGYDTVDSNALCADTQMCQYMCDQLEDCVSVDMHKEIPRCFLNMKTEQCTGTHAEELMRDPNYVLLIKGAEANDEQAGTNAAVRRLLPGVDYGFSWDKMLRFKPIQFKTGGTFKLCFCDSEVLSPGAVCSSLRDYKIEIGTVHASGVSCLISNPKLQRVSCTDQMHGGLRCYAHAEAPTPEPPAIGLTDLPAASLVTPLSISTACAFVPESEIPNRPDCQRL